MRDYENIIFNNLITSLKSAASITQASIRQAETHMQKIEALAKDRKILRYHVSELSRALDYYSIAERGSDRFEALIESTDAMAVRLNKKERKILVQKIKELTKEMRADIMQLEQEKNVIKELEMLALKIELGKIKKTTHKEA